MSRIKNQLKKVCRKQSKKIVKRQAAQNIVDLSKKARKKWAGQLAKQAYKEMSRQPVMDTSLRIKRQIKRQIKHQIRMILGQLIESRSSRNDDQFRIQAELVEVKSANTLDVSKPFKSKPCGSCPALRNGLCKCALKRQQLRKAG